MASGEVATASVDRAGAAPRLRLTSSGRVSGVTEPGAVSLTYPFPVKDLVRARRRAEVRFAQGQGPLRGVHRRPRRGHRGDRARGAADVPTPNNAVLLAVSPNQKAIEVVSGEELQGRGIEESAPLGVNAAAASFNYGNLIAGLVSAIKVMAAGVTRSPDSIGPDKERRVAFSVARRPCFSRIWPSSRRRCGPAARVRRSRGLRAPTAEAMAAVRRPGTALRRPTRPG